MDTSIIQRLKEFRKSENLTQGEFADKLGVSQSYIAGVERGIREINTQTLKALKDVFGISSDWLLFGDESKSEMVKALKVALALDDASRLNSMDTWALYEWTKTSKQTKHINILKDLQENNFQEHFNEIKELDEQKSSIYLAMLKHNVTEERDITEIPDKIKDYIEINLEIHEKLMKIRENSGLMEIIRFPKRD